MAAHDPMAAVKLATQCLKGLQHLSHAPEDVAVHENCTPDPTLGSINSADDRLRFRRAAQTLRLWCCEFRSISPATMQSERNAWMTVDNLLKQLLKALTDGPCKDCLSSQLREDLTFALRDARRATDIREWNLTAIEASKQPDGGEAYVPECSNEDSEDHDGNVLSKYEEDEWCLSSSDHLHGSQELCADIEDLIENIVELTPILSAHVDPEPPAPFLPSPPIETSMSNQTVDSGYYTISWSPKLLSPGRHADRFDCLDGGTSLYDFGFDDYLKPLPFPYDNFNTDPFKKRSSSVSKKADLQPPGHASAREFDHFPDPGDPQEPKYCYCLRGSYGDMIACDNPACEREWFHVGCTGLEEPKEDDRWICSLCRPPEKTSIRTGTSTAAIDTGGVEGTSRLKIPSSTYSDANSVADEAHAHAERATGALHGPGKSVGASDRTFPSIALAPREELCGGDIIDRAVPEPPLVSRISVELRTELANESQDSSKQDSSTEKHKCPYCSTGFTRHHNLKSHLLTHSQEKAYVCQTCNARFRRSHDLKRHTKLHTGERSHVCATCGRRFARGDALSRHNKGPGGCAGRQSSCSGDDGFSDREDVTDKAEHAVSDEVGDASSKAPGLPGPVHRSDREAVDQTALEHDGAQDRDPGSRLESGNMAATKGAPKDIPRIESPPGI